MNKVIIPIIVILIIAAGIGAYFVFQKPVPSKCGDGVCDAKEKANLDLCPRDCQGEQPKAYVYFVVNLNDFRHNDYSAEYLSKIIDLFNKHNIGLDLYFTEPVLKAYEKEHPEIVEKIKKSQNITINYHVRLPHPIDEHILKLPDDNGECKKITEYDINYVIDKIKEFESHELVVDDYDFKDKNYCPHYDENKIGGYDYVKRVFNTDPIFTGVNIGGPPREAFLKVLKEKGITGYVAYHMGETDKNNPLKYSQGLLERPSDFGIQFEKSVSGDSYQEFTDSLNNFSDYNRTVFANVIVHEHEFYHNGVWYVDDIIKDGKLIKNGWEKTKAEQDKYWESYERLVLSIINNPSVKVVNAKDIMEMAEKSATGTKTRIYATFVTHNERSPSVPCNEIVITKKDNYLANRKLVVNFVRMVKEHNAALSYGTDWQYINVSKTWDTPDVMKDTDGKNLNNFIAEFDPEHITVEAHAHPGRGSPAYNYADVAYWITSMGIKDEKVLSGFIYYPVDKEDWTQFKNPQTGRYFTNYSWKPEIMWGASEGGHTSMDSKDSGIWRPKDATHFYEDDPNGNIIYVGGHSSVVDIISEQGNNIRTLISELHAGKLKEGEIYTASIFLNPCSLTDKDIDEYAKIIDEFKTEVDDGHLVWATLPEIVRIWKTEYNSKPNIYIFNKSTTPTLNQSPQGKCGDGVCDSFEKTSGLCPKDCK